MPIHADYDVLRMQNSSSDVHLETVGDYLEITNLNDGAMLGITNAEAEVFFNWFHARTNFDQLSDSEYIQTLFQNTLQRSATTDEVNGYFAQLDDGSLNRDWLAVDIAQSEETIAVIGSVIAFDGGF